jgi:hypothetical protein
MGSPKDHEFVFELTRQDGAMLSPELRDSCRWNRTIHQKGGGVEYAPVWMRKDPTEGSTFGAPTWHLVIHDGKTNAVVLTGNSTMPGPGTRHVEIQVSLHALPKGFPLGPVCACNGGSDWLGWTQDFANQRQGKADRPDGKKVDR